MALHGRHHHYISFSVHTYVKLLKGMTPKAVEARLPALVAKYAAGNGYRYFLQPLRSIHLHSNLESEIKSNGNISYVYVLIAIATFLILIACINFMNMATISFQAVKAARTNPANALRFE